MTKQILHLIKHEFNLELKQKQFLSSIIMYIVSTVFVCYLTFKSLENTLIWNGVFWVIILFSLTNAIAKSFNHENSSYQLFIYTLVNPRALILSKIIYNTLLTFALVIIAYILFTIFIQTDSSNLTASIFVTGLALGSFAISSTLTLVSAIAAKTNNNLGILAILAFPIVLPTLLIAIKVTSLAMQGGAWADITDQLITLGAINMMVVTLAFLLFPYLWRQ